MSYETITKTSTSTRYVEDEPAINTDGTAAREVSPFAMAAALAATVVLGGFMLIALIGAF